MQMRVITHARIHQHNPPLHSQAHADWALAAKHGKDAPWPYDEKVADEPLAI